MKTTKLSIILFFLPTGYIQAQNISEFREENRTGVSAEGTLYIYDEKNGNVGLLKANPEKFDLVSSFKVTQSDSVPFWTHPVIHNGVLYIRHTNALMAYIIKAK